MPDNQIYFRLHRSITHCQENTARFEQVSPVGRKNEWCKLKSIPPKMCCFGNLKAEGLNKQNIILHSHNSEHIFFSQIDFSHHNIWLIKSKVLISSSPVRKQPWVMDVLKEIWFFCEQHEQCDKQNFKQQFKKVKNWIYKFGIYSLSNHAFNPGSIS